FNPPFVPARLNGMHLRNHRKILVVDGAVGFTGGMNIDKRYWRPEAPAEAFRDLHFTTDEALRGEPWFPPLAPAGDVLVRGIEAGPDEALDRMRWAIVGGLH